MTPHDPANKVAEYIVLRCWAEREQWAEFAMISRFPAITNVLRLKGKNTFLRTATSDDMGRVDPAESWKRAEIRSAPAPPNRQRGVVPPGDWLRHCPPLRTRSSGCLKRRKVRRAGPATSRSTRDVPTRRIVSRRMAAFSPEQLLKILARENRRFHLMPLVIWKLDLRSSGRLIWHR